MEINQSIKHSNAPRLCRCSVGLRIEPCLMLGRLQSGKFVVLLLVFVEEAADSQQHECCDNKVVDRLCDTICTLTSATIKSMTRRSWIINCFK